MRKKMHVLARSKTPLFMFTHTSRTPFFSFLCPRPKQKSVTVNSAAAAYKNCVLTLEK